MPFVTFAEQYYMEKGMKKGFDKGFEDGAEKGRSEGLIQGIELALELKFGQAGLDLMAQVRAIQDPARLQEILPAIREAATPDALREKLAEGS